MGFYNGFPEEPRHPKRFTYFIVALLGAILGVILYTGVLYLFDMGPAALPWKQELPQEPEFSWPERNEEGEDRNLELQEHQQTAIVRAAEKATPWVVGINNYAHVFDLFRRQEGLQLRATGSGVIISSDGYIVTNYHVIDNYDEISVILGTGEEVPAQVVGEDPPTDLAVLKINKSGLPAAAFADSDKVRVGETVIAIGNPLGITFQQTVTVGVVSATERQVPIGEYNFNFIQTDAAINDGNSGGALVNILGEVIGINTAKIKISGVEGMGFAIPSNTVKKITGDLIRHGEVIRPSIGIYVNTVNEIMAERRGLPIDYGVLIEEVIPRSPAEKAGLQAGDIIIAVDGKEIRDFLQLQETLFAYEIGEKVKVTVNRQGVEKTFEVVLDRMPEQAR